MGVTLSDKRTDAIVFNANFWHWRAIVEAVRTLKVLPESRVDSLHEVYIGDLTETEVRAVATAIRDRLLPKLIEGERLFLDGSSSIVQDDGTMHYEPEDQHKNYSTNRKVLEDFVFCCETCNGFVVA